MNDAASTNEFDEHGAETFDAGDWARLRELRAGFLGAESNLGARPNYWTSLRDLELYDATFGRRIAWKWDAVLSELERRGALKPAANVVDWGCGTGVAVRRFAANAKGLRRVYLCDQSKQATWFARDALLTEFGRLQAKLQITLQAPPLGERIDVLLVSHVIEELDASALRELLELARRAERVIWVEAGSRTTSRTLGGVRAELLEHFEVEAPCTHQAACGALTAAGSDHFWCHFFAKPPAEAFTSAFWRRFAVELSIDLRSLPYSFLALRRGSSTAQSSVGVRVIGRPRRMKGRALLDVCDASGLRECALLERVDKRLFRRLDEPGELLHFDVKLDGQRIVEIAPRGEART